MAASAHVPVVSGQTHWQCLRRHCHWHWQCQCHKHCHRQSASLRALAGAVGASGPRHTPSQWQWHRYYCAGPGAHHHQQHPSLLRHRRWRRRRLGDPVVQVKHLPVGLAAVPAAHSQAGGNWRAVSPGRTGRLTRRLKGCPRVGKNPRKPQDASASGGAVAKAALAAAAARL